MRTLLLCAASICLAHAQTKEWAPNEAEITVRNNGSNAYTFEVTNGNLMNETTRVTPWGKEANNPHMTFYPGQQIYWIFGQGVPASHRPMHIDAPGDNWNVNDALEWVTIEFETRHAGSTFSYFCSNHPAMTGNMTVRQNPCSAKETLVVGAWPLLCSPHTEIPESAATIDFCMYMHSSCSEESLMPMPHDTMKARVYNTDFYSLYQENRCSQTAILRADKHMPFDCNTIAQIAQPELLSSCTTGLPGMPTGMFTSTTCKEGTPAPSDTSNVTRELEDVNGLTDPDSTPAPSDTSNVTRELEDVNLTDPDSAPAPPQTKPSPPPSPPVIFLDTTPYKASSAASLAAPPCLLFASLAALV